MPRSSLLVTIINHLMTGANPSCGYTNECRVIKWKEWLVTPTSNDEISCLAPSNVQ